MPEQAATEKKGTVKVKISPDKMRAEIAIEPPMGVNEWPTLEDAMKVLSYEGVSYGIDEEAVSKVISYKSKDFTKVAEGLQPENGVDAELNFLFPIPGTYNVNQEIALKEDKNGNVDFHELNNLKNVVVGEILLEKTPPTPGTPGKNVLGLPVKQAPGRDKKIGVGKNVLLTQDGLKVVSKIDGEPSFFQNVINVYPTHTINGDINFKTGNVSFLGTVVVKGNVTSGFKISAEGDVIIQGVVEAAEIVAKGNITINGGVSGMGKCLLQCGGDFTAKYVDNVVLKCGGNIMVRESIMYSQIVCEGSIDATLGKGLIVGGDIKVGEVIHAKTIGSRLGTVTCLELGVKQKFSQELDEINDKIKENEKTLEKIGAILVALEKLPDLNVEQKNTWNNLRKTTMSLKDDVAKSRERRDAVLVEMASLARTGAQVRVKQTMFSAVKITIAKSILTVADELEGVTAYFDGKNIQYKPYEI